MIQKVSQITTQNIADYLRLDNANNEELETYLNIAKNYIINYTGIEDLDEFSDFVIVVYVLCQDMYDNRALYVDKTNINKIVQTILDMHSRNQL